MQARLYTLHLLRDLHSVTIITHTTNRVYLHLLVEYCTFYYDLTTL